MELIYLLAGLLVGSASVYFALKFYFVSKTGIPQSEYDLVNLELSRTTEKALLFEKQLLEFKDDLSKERLANSLLNSENSKLINQNKNLEERLAEQKKELEEINMKLKNEFMNLANQIFEEKSRKFSEYNKDAVQNLLNPLNDKINDFRRRIDEIHNTDVQGRATLMEQIRNLTELNKQMSEDADNLTKALKGDSKTMGTWGEVVLERLLEKSGLIKDEQYTIQESLTGEEGRKFRPDVIIYLPDEKNIIIDSKVSLVAYEKFSSSSDEVERKRFIQEHIVSVRNHLKELSSKNYQSITGLNSPDFVLMFIPIEPAFALAIQKDQSIYNDAFEKNIVIVSPSTLLATLRTIENIWRREKQNKNALEIARQSGALYDKFTSFIEDMIEVGKKLNASKESYNSAMKKLHEGRGNIVKRIEEIKELGAKASKSLPSALIEKAD